MTRSFFSTVVLCMWIPVYLLGMAVLVTKSIHKPPQIVSWGTVYSSDVIQGALDNVALPCRYMTTLNWRAHSFEDDIMAIRMDLIRTYQQS